MRRVCAGHIPLLLIWIQLDHGQGLARIHLEQGYASGICAGDETPVDLPRRLSTKNKYALGMRRPHSSLAIGIQLEHGLDLAAHHLEFSLSDDCSPESKTVSHKYVASIRIVPRRLLHEDTYAPGYAPHIYIYIYAG